MTVQVHLVGAGPGDPGLITRRGLDLLRRADVVIYDRLVSPELLEEAPATAELVFVGKQPGDRLVPQAEIDRKIVEAARRGSRVVRLKGGDPFVFGRGADEAQALAAAGIPFEVVPGVTSAVAVPAYAGIPVTHSGVSSSFAVITAHHSADRPGARERWRALATGAETLVLLMGVSTLRDVSERLIEAGRSPDEPAAVVEWGTTSTQRTVVGTLETIADLASAESIKPPATTIVGPVVRLREAVSWFETRPLFGRTVVVTRPHRTDDPLVASLEELGARVLKVPVVEVVDPPSFDDLDLALGELPSFDWVVFASVNAVDRFFARLARYNADARALARVNVAAVGKATAGALSRRGIKADLVPEHATGIALAEAIGDGVGRVLLPRPLDAPSILPDALRDRGWEVVEAAAYATQAASGRVPHDQEVADGDYDLIAFASPSALSAFIDRFGPPKAAVACIGTTTAGAAREAGVEVDVVPSEHGAEALAAAIVEHLRK